MFSFELVGDQELATKFSDMPASVRGIIEAKMGSEVNVLLAAVRGNLDVYASATLENHGPSGKIAASLRSSVASEGDMVIGRVWPDEAVAPYAGVQERGGGGGVAITPKSPQGLMIFIWKSKAWFLKYVTRGDTPAKRYLRNALETEGPAIAERLGAAVLDEVAKL